MDKNYPLRLAILLFFLHIGGILLFFPPQEIFSSGPVIADDYAFHAYHVYASLHFLKSHRIWGYDPHFMAGFIFGSIYINIVSLKLFVFLLHLLGWDIWVSFKFFILATFLAFPFFIYFSGKNFGFSKESSLIAFILAILYWHLGPLINPMVKFGMFNYVFSTCIVVYLLSLFYKAISSHKIKDFLWFFFWSLIGLSLHVLTGPSLGLALIIAIFFLKVQKRELLLLALGEVVVLAGNLFWILPFINHLSYKGYSGTHFLARGFISIIGDFFFKPGFGMRNIAVILGLGGLSLLRRTRLFFVLFFNSLVFFIFAYFGTYLHIFRELQPRRFILQSVVFLLLPAGFFLWKNKVYLKRIKLKHLVMIVLISAVFIGPSLGKSILWVMRGRHIFSTFPPLGSYLITWIRENTDSKARILIQDSSQHYYFGSHFVALLPYYTHREFIGGPIPEMMHIFYKKINFVDNYLFGRRIESYSEREFLKLLDDYNIKWIIVFTREAKELLERLSSFIEKKDTKSLSEFELSFYEVKRKPNFAYHQDLEVEADYDRITVKSAKRGRVILKYHWVPELKVKEGLPIFPYKVEGLPFAFIQVDNSRGLEEFHIVLP